MRIDRLYALALHLSRHENLTAAKLAEHFEVSIRTIHRDLETLDMAGVPVVTRQGRGGGVSLMSGYRLEGGYLTRKELRELALTLEGIAPILSGTSVPSIAGKVAAMNRTDRIFSDKAETYVPPVDIDLRGWSRRPEWKKTMTALTEAIKTEHAVGFAYMSLNDVKTERDVEPLKVIFRNSTWYLSGWCRLRRSYRWFNVSRIENIRLLESRFDRRGRLNEMKEDDGFSEPVTDISLSLTEKGLAKARHYLDQDSVRSAGKRHTALLRWPMSEWVYSFLLGLGPEVSVIAPDEVRSEMALRIAQMAGNYASADS